MPSQQVATGPAPMEGVEWTNAVVVRGPEQGMGAPRRNPYAMEINRRRNYYACGSFGHMAHYYKNQRRERAMEGRRVEYEERRFEGNTEQIEHLKEVENLEALD